MDYQNIFTLIILPLVITIIGGVFIILIQNKIVYYQNKFLNWKAERSIVTIEKRINKLKREFEKLKEIEMSPQKYLKLVVYDFVFLFGLSFFTLSILIVLILLFILDTKVPGEKRITLFGLIALLPVVIAPPILLYKLDRLSNLTRSILYFSDTEKRFKENISILENKLKEKKKLDS